MKANAILTFIKDYALALVWGSFILFATLSSGGTLSQLHLSELFAYDKPIHMTLFGVQAWLIIKGMKRSSVRSYHKMVLYACLISTFYGVITEVLQGLIVLFGRSFDFFDMLADSVGCLIVYFWLMRKHKPLAQ